VQYRPPNQFQDGVKKCWEPGLHSDQTVTVGGESFPRLSDGCKNFVNLIALDLKQNLLSYRLTKQYFNLMADAG